MNYKELEIWKVANEITSEIHNMTLILPDFEKYEIGGQIRLSANVSKK